jgi:hypothetical protein
MGFDGLKPSASGETLQAPLVIHNFALRKAGHIGAELDHLVAVRDSVVIVLLVVI